MFRLTDILFSVAAKVDSVAPMKNHVAGAVKDKLLRELEGRTGETDSDHDEEEENHGEEEVLAAA